MPSVHEEVSTARRDGYLRGLLAALTALHGAPELLREPIMREYRRVVSGGSLPD